MKMWLTKNKHLVFLVLEGARRVRIPITGHEQWARIMALLDTPRICEIIKVEGEDTNE